MNTLDKVTMRELELFIDNDYGLYIVQFMPIIRNVQRKMRAGKYDHAKAPKLWLYLIEAGAKKYTKEFCGTGVKWHEIFSKAEREALAQEYADYYKTAIENGEYDH